MTLKQLAAGAAMALVTSFAAHVAQAALIGPVLPYRVLSPTRASVGAT